MSLVDRYREELKSQGINVDIQGTKIKKDRTKLFLFIIGAAIAIPVYFLIFTNYNACVVYAGNLSAVSGGSSSALNGSFYLKCGVNSIMYSVAAALLIFIILLILMKIFVRRRAGKNL
ncbi:MAG: hypothetical protein BJBARM5_0037 [Candidatus Parvarchaeum acidophilus ARMAN-5]|jgi:VIT1/CCC1 family predicted Fe2+/Mn2+ transporter|uniref:Uncharacterized protein n=1 Tax=Candidatus Parvarchaeum acidophilus ARMAN-5 TaxID=662762 RepID=D6GUB2_PARA5|nr:MAG: hypothetical protein BJBARM5_0037 [Candidatus Parvarchaeum acidophilus ARMAN-5]